MARLGRTIPRRLNRAPVVASSALPDPGTVLDIGSARGNHFLLQYAQTGAGAVDTATQADILGGFTIDPYFKTTADSLRVQLWARLDAPLLGSSTFSRAELREVNADGTDAAWDPYVGTHIFDEVITVTHLPAVTPAGVFFQMFDSVATSDRISYRTQLVSATARLRLRINGSTATLDAGGTDLAVGVGSIVGVANRLRVVIVNGAISIFFNDMVTPVLTRPAGTLAANGASCYFKTGIYNQANTGTGDAGTDWGSVEIAPPAVVHAGAAAALLGGLTASASGVRKATGSAAAPLGALTASAAGGRVITGTAAAPLGALSASATGVRRTSGAATAPLGALTAAAAGTRTTAGSASAGLGALTSTVTGTRAASGTATASLGALAATATGLVQPQPIAAYSFDETGSTVIDVTGNGHGFTLGSNLVRTVDGHTDGGLTTLAGGAITTLSTAVFGQTPDRTVMMWARGTGSVWYIRWQVASIDSGAWGILRLGSDIGVQLRNAGGFQRFMTTGPTDGQWHHYAATYNETTGDAVFYLDGVSAASGTFTGPIRTDADSLDLAEFGPGTIVDDLRIYDVALTAGQVAIAAATPVGSSPVGAAAAVLGGLTASATGVRTTAGSASAPLGGLTTAATGTRSTAGTASAPLGALAAGATSVRSTAGTAAAALGGLTAASSGIRTVAATAASPLGGLTATSSGTRRTAGSAAAPLGGLTATAAGHHIWSGTATAALGALTAAASGVRSAAATVAAALGGLVAIATGTRVTAATAATPLGGLVAEATGSGFGAGGGSAQAPLGALSAAATGVRTATGSAVSTLGELTAHATGVNTHLGTAAAPLGALTASAAGVVVGNGAGAATAELGALTASATGIRTASATAAAPLGGLTATAASVRYTTGSAAAALGALSSSAAGTGISIVTGTATANLGALIAAALGATPRPPSLGPLHADAIVDGPHLGADVAPERARVAVGIVDTELHATLT